MYIKGKKERAGTSFFLPPAIHSCFADGVAGEASSLAPTT